MDASSNESSPIHQSAEVLPVIAIAKKNLDSNDDVLLPANDLCEVEKLMDSGITESLSISSPPPQPMSLEHNMATGVYNENRWTVQMSAFH